MNKINHNRLARMSQRGVGFDRNCPRRASHKQVKLKRGNNSAPKPNPVVRTVETRSAGRL